MTIVTFKAHEVFKAEAKDMKSKSEWTHQNVKTLLMILLIGDDGTDAILDKTVHPTENLISMNLLQMSCVITWAWLFLTFEVVEAVRGQKHHICTHMFGSSYSAKDSIRNPE